jgi:hypothetical protein
MPVCGCDLAAGVQPGWLAEVGEADWKWQERSDSRRVSWLDIWSVSAAAEPPAATAWAAALMPCR